LEHTVRLYLCAAFCVAAFAGNFDIPLCLGQETQPSPAAATPAGAKSPAPPTASSSDLAAIRAGSQSFVAAFNKGDAKAIAALWTKDGDYVDDAGHTFAGRDAIEKGYAAHFAANSKIQIRVVIDSLKLLSDSAAIEDGRAMVEPAPAGAPGHSKYTAVHVKVDGKWMMSTVRDTHVETPSAFNNVADLEWLIGTWTAEENGAKTESVCRWVANKSFVERSYTVTRVDGTSTTGVQMIGWNPQGGHVQSWNFSSDGGHAVGIWSPRDGGWSAEIRGMTGDGIETSAVNTLTRLDDNAYVWQSTNRSVGGQSLLDTDEIVMKRRPASK
jgi:uncharacterized protein (TIGR02246 family)